MIGLTAFTSCADVRAIDASRTTSNGLRRSKVVIRRWGCWTNRVAVVAEDVQRLNVVCSDLSPGVTGNARIHDADKNEVVFTGLSPVTGLIAVCIVSG